MHLWQRMHSVAFLRLRESLFTHRLEEDRDGTNVFAESAIILEHHGKKDAHHIIDQVADEKQHE